MITFIFTIKTETERVCEALGNAETFRYLASLLETSEMVVDWTYHATFTNEQESCTLNPADFPKYKPYIHG